MTDGHLGPPRRARRDDEKAGKRRGILLAAESLLDGRVQSLPSVARIAAASKMAKGTIYLYFESKEEIFLALLSEQLGSWIESVKSSLRQDPATFDGLLDAYVGFAVKHPKTLFLAQMSSSILERNISEGTAYEFKRQLADEVRAVGALLASAFRGLSRDRSEKLFILVHLLTVGLWQHINPPPLIARVYRRKALLSLRLDFESELRAAFLALLKGSLK